MNTAYSLQEGPSETPTTAEHTSDCDYVVTRAFSAPLHKVFAAWSEAALFQRWWVPKSFGLTLLSCEMDARMGGKYCLTFRHPESGEPLPFHGTYVAVSAPCLLSWSNDEEGGAAQITTVKFAESAGGTSVTMQERYPSKDALDEAIATGTVCSMDEPFAQLDELLAATT